MKKSQKSKVKSQKSGTGFTLIEMLVVISVMAVLSTFLINLMFLTLKSNSKSEAVKEVKQNGEYVLSVLGYFIRNAVSLDPGSCTTTSFVVTEDDGNATTFSCLGLGTDDGYIASNAARLTSTKVTIPAGGCSISCTQTGNSPPVVGINFTLSTLSTATNPEDKGSANFTTTITTRTY